METGSMEAIPATDAPMIARRNFKCGSLPRCKSLRSWLASSTRVMVNRVYHQQIRPATVSWFYAYQGGSVVDRSRARGGNSTSTGLAGAPKAVAAVGRAEAAA